MWFTLQVAYAPQISKEKLNPVYTKMAEDIFQQGKVPTEKESVHSLALLLQKCGGNLKLEKATVVSLNKISSITNDERAVLDAASCISLFAKSPEEAIKIANKLEEIAKNTNDGKAVSHATSCVSLYEKNPAAAVGITESLRKINFNHTSDDMDTNSKMVSKVAETLALNYAIDFLAIFRDNPKISEDVAETLGELCINTTGADSGKVVLWVVSNISLYVPKEATHAAGDAGADARQRQHEMTAVDMMRSLRDVSMYTKAGFQIDGRGIIFYTKGGKAVMDSAACAGLFAKASKEGSSVLNSLAGIANYTMSENAVSISAAYLSSLVSRPDGAAKASLRIGSIAFSASNKAGNEGNIERENAVIDEVTRLAAAEHRNRK